MASEGAGAARGAGVASEPGWPGLQAVWSHTSSLPRSYLPTLIPTLIPTYPRRYPAEYAPMDTGGAEGRQIDRRTGRPAPPKPLVSPPTTGEGTGATAPHTIWFQSTAKLQAFKGATCHANGL